MQWRWEVCCLSACSGYRNSLFQEKKDTGFALYVTPGCKNAISTVQTPGSNFHPSPYSDLSSGSRCVRIPQILHGIVRFPSSAYLSSQNGFLKVKSALEKELRRERAHIPLRQCLLPWNNTFWDGFAFQKAPFLLMGSLWSFPLKKRKKSLFLFLSSRFDLNPRHQCVSIFPLSF